MEVMLLWLDELDDVVFTAALAWEQLRRLTLAIGLGASFALAAAELSALGLEWATAFSGVAAGCVGAWLAGAAFRILYYRAKERLPAAA